MPKLHINDIDLHYEIKGQGQPVLLIHGLGSSARDWEEQLPAFSRQYQVITFDLRGHGQSHKPPGPYTISLFAGDAVALIKLLGVEPVHVVGISLGGMIAFQMAVDHPEVMKSVVIVNSGPELIARTLKDHWQVFMRFAVVRLLGMRKMGEVLSQRLFPKEEQAGIRQVFVERWAENNPRAYLDTMRAIIGWSVTDHLPRIDLPALVVAADGDYTPVSVKQEYIARMPNAELVVIPDSHHATPVDSPAKFNEVVMSFIQKHS